MIYDSFVGIPEGFYYFIQKPSMDGYDLVNFNNAISQQVELKCNFVHGISTLDTSKMKVYVADFSAYGDIMVSENKEELEKALFKEINRLKTDLEAHLNSIMSKFNTVIKPYPFETLSTRFPEVLI